MAKYSASLITQFNRPVADPVWQPNVKQWLAGIDSTGHFWSFSYSYRNLSVRHIDNPSVEIDRIVLPNNASMEFPSASSLGSSNYLWSTQSVYSYTTNSYSALDLHRHSVVSGSINRELVGTLPSWLGATGGTHTMYLLGLHHQTDQYILVTSRLNTNGLTRRFTVFDTGTMSIVHDHQADAASHSACWPLAWPSTNKVLRTCNTHSAIELVEISSGTVLDSTSFSTSGYYSAVPAENVAIYTVGISSNVTDVICVDVSNDTIARQWKNRVTSDWGDVPYGATIGYYSGSPFAVVGSWIQGSNKPNDGPWPNYDPMSLALVDVSSGRISFTPSSSLLGMGADGWFVDTVAIPLGTDKFMTLQDDDDNGPWSVWNVTAGSSTQPSSGAPSPPVKQSLVTGPDLIFEWNPA